jgi:hypothetical protein
MVKAIPDSTSFVHWIALDAYSRKIIWLYCGNSSRTAISVVRQCFNAAMDLCPRFIRTDKDTEKSLLCDIHLSIFVEAALREELSNEYYQSLRISDCYMYDPSTRNIRIKRLWRPQLVTTTVMCRISAGSNNVAGVPDKLYHQARYTLMSKNPSWTSTQ